MSFSQTVKGELVEATSPARHCQIAELTAILQFCGQIDLVEGAHLLCVQTENPYIAQKAFYLWKKITKQAPQIRIGHSFPQKRTSLFTISAECEQQTEKLFQILKIPAAKMVEGDLSFDVDDRLLKNNCCNRAYLRGAYLAIGSMSDPDKSYHLEFVCRQSAEAEKLAKIFEVFDLQAKIVQRKKYQVVYFKEGEQIVDLLNIIEAHRALMELENTRIFKEMRNSINRRVNCETANIAKTATAASKQMEDILYLQKHYGLNKLPENLKQMASLRLEYPEATLKELAELTDPPMGKSGVNHRLRKLSQLAEKLRGE